jgi:hypothetical protein
MTKEPETRFKEGLVLGVIAALIWSLLPAWRVAGVSSVAAYAALAGSAALLMAPLSGSLRLLKPDARAFLGALLGLATSSAPLSILGALLKMKTHHRQLGGVTFAIVGATLTVACVLISVRMTDSRRHRVLLTACAAGAAAVSAGLTTWWLFAGSPPVLRHAAVDAFVGLALLMAAALAPEMPTGTARYGVPVWVTLSALGILLLRIDHALGGVLSVQAPVVLGLGAFLGASAG